MKMVFAALFSLAVVLSTGISLANAGDLPDCAFTQSPGQPPHFQCPAP